MTYRPDRLVSAYEDCQRGSDGRAAVADAVRPLLEAYAGLFGAAPEALPGVPVRRFVLARTFGRDFGTVNEVFADRDADKARRRIETYASAKTASKEFSRLLQLERTRVLSDDPVTAVALNGQRVA